MQSQIIRTGAYEAFYGMPLFINWVLTYICNYNCSYCFGHDKFDKNAFSSWDDLKRCLDHISALNRSQYNFTLTGGEPTIHPHFYDLIDAIDAKLGENVNRITVISNGSPKAEYYSRLFNIARKHHLTLIISIHTEHAQLKHIAEIVENYSGRINLMFNLMFNPDKYDFTVSAYDLLCNLRKNYAFQMSLVTIREPPKFSKIDSRYTPQMLDWQQKAQKQFADIAAASQSKCELRPKHEYKTIRQIFEDGRIKLIEGGNRYSHLINGRCRYNGLYCIAGTHMLRINANGSYKGLICPHERYTGNLYKEDTISLLDYMHIVKCPEENCGCESNDPIPKFLDKSEAEHFLGIFKEKQKILLR